MLLSMLSVYCLYKIMHLQTISPDGEKQAASDGQQTAGDKRRCILSARICASVRTAHTRTVNCYRQNFSIGSPSFSMIRRNRSSMLSIAFCTYCCGRRRHASSMSSGEPSRSPPNASDSLRPVSLHRIRPPLTTRFTKLSCDTGRSRDCRSTPSSRIRVRHTRWIRLARSSFRFTRRHSI